MNTSSSNLPFPSTTSSSISPTSSHPLNTRKRTRIISELHRGWEAAVELRGILVAAGDRTLEDQEKVSAVNLSAATVSSFSSCLSICSADFESPSYSVKGSEAGKGVMFTKAKSGRDCHKSRIKNCKKKELETTDLTDDGFVWRKYGQKPIQRSAYPRHYYKCTHWDDEKCQATKWVQQVSEEPSLYRTTYNCEHTCLSRLTTSDVSVDACSFLNDETDHSSHFYLNFDGRESNHPWATTIKTEDDGVMNNQHVFISNPSSSSSSSISIHDMAKPKEIDCDDGHNLLVGKSNRQIVHEDKMTTMALNQYPLDDYAYMSSSLPVEPMTNLFSSSYAPINTDVDDYYMAGK